MYKTLEDLLGKAGKFNYTVGSFNMHNLEMLPPMIMAAKEMDECRDGCIHWIWRHRLGVQVFGST